MQVLLQRITLSACTRLRFSEAIRKAHADLAGVRWTGPGNARPERELDWKDCQFLLAGTVEGAVQLESAGVNLDVGEWTKP